MTPSATNALAGGAEVCPLELKKRDVDIDIKRIIKDVRGLDQSKLVWRNIIIFLVLHLVTVRGLYNWFTGKIMWQTIVFSVVLGYYAGLGITMGAHRLWAHRTFKANFPLRFLLAVAQTIAIQNHIYEWSRDHRVHHKFSETNADPHNAERGFFFSHMGWLMMKKHPDVARKGKTVDLSDLLQDPIVYYQRKFYIPLVLLLSVIMPAFVPWYFWGESFQLAFIGAFITRYVINLHFTWLVNSWAHWKGAKPFDRYIYPVQSKLVAFLALGEGWHNYHHVFPHDYRTAELGGHMGYNLTTLVIDFFAKIGWAYDLKKVPVELVERRARRTGDGSRLPKLVDNNNDNNNKEKFEDEKYDY